MQSESKECFCVFDNRWLKCLGAVVCVPAVSRNIGKSLLIDSVSTNMSCHRFIVLTFEMCLKSPGTDVGATGFERCPRTFETHFSSGQI